MNCFRCDQPMLSGRAEWDTYGAHHVIVHTGGCDRGALIRLAVELGCVADADKCTDQALIDAIVAEKLCGEWLNRLERLPTDEAKRDAVHRLRVGFDQVT